MTSPNPAGASATFKARDVEELIDFYLHRRLANVVVRILAPTRVTPDQVTISSGLVAIAGGIVMAFAPNVTWLAVGTVIFFFSIVLDCSDGQLARLRGTSSFAGRYLDGLVDVGSTGAVFLGTCAWLVRSGMPFWPTFLTGWVVGYAVKWHVHHYDHIKNLYLLNTEDSKKAGDAYPSLEAIDAEIADHEAHGRKFYASVTRGFRGFTIAQRKAANETGDELRAQIPEERALYRRTFRTFMRLWSFNGLGTHLFLLVAANLLAAVHPFAPFAMWMFILGPLSLYQVGLFWMRRRLERRFDGEVLALRASPSA